MKRLSKQSSISTFIKKNKICDSNLSETIETINEEQTIESSSKLICNDDISFFVNKILTDAERKLILTDFWIPPNNFNFPIESIRNLKFQIQWIDQSPWILYSKIENGIYCKYCLIFAKDVSGKGNNQKLSNFVSKSFNNWRKAKEIFNKHEKTDYHNTCKIMADNFLSVINGKQISVINILNIERARQAEINKKKLTSIVKTIILCGRQELPLRGKIDYGNVLNCDNKNDGTFRSLLRFRVDAGDTVLEDHFINDNNRLQYTSPSIQNEFVDICSKIIKKKIVDNINNSKYFAVLADETTDISNVEQMSLCLRYIDLINNVIREDFLEFIPVYDMTGRGLALTIITRLKGT